MLRTLWGLVAAFAVSVLPVRAIGQLSSGILYNDTASITTYLGDPGATVQDISLTHHNRGVFIDGSLIARPTFPWRLEGNPWAQDYYNEKAWWGSNIRLATGTYLVTAIDLELPAPGFTWPIARSYNARQHDGSSYQTSAGYQGNNWFQMSQPQLVFLDNDSNPATREAEDRLFLIYGADRYVEFLRIDDDEDEFRAINGAAGVIQHVVNASAPDLFIFYDPFGIETVFFGFDDSDGTGTLPKEKEGVLWKISDPAGNVAYVGDESSGAAALSSGYDANGRITTAYDTAGRRYTYTYVSGVLTQVVAETKTNPTWSSPGTVTEVGRVQYAYYTALSGGNSPNDLKRVTTTLPIADGTLDDIRVTYYRYADSASLIKYVLDPEGTRNFDWTEDGVFNEGYESAIDDDIKSFAAAGFTYDGENRLATAYFNGECGCSGGVNGEHAFTYEASAYYNANKTSAYNPFWATRTVTKLPDEPSTSASTGSLRAYFVNYFDETGQPLGRIIMAGTDGGVPGSPVVGSGGDTFAAWAERNADGQFIKLTGHTSATAYDHSNQVGDQAPVTLSTSDGLVLYFTRVGSGDVAGFMAAHGDRKGTGGTAVLRGSFEYTTRTRTIGAATLVRPLMTESWQYMTATSTVKSGTDNSALEFASTFFSDTPGDRDFFAIKAETITWPAVPTAQNGSGSTDDEIYYFRKDGTTAFHRSTDGVFTHWSRDGYGQTDMVILDANTASGDYDDGDEPSGTWGISEIDAGLHEGVSYEYDEQGRLVRTTRNPGGQYERILPTHHHVLADRRIVTLGIPLKDATKWYGPVDYRVYNQAGMVEVSATIAIDPAGTTSAPIAWIDEGDDDPVSAVSTGSVAHLSVNVYDDAGVRLDEARVFHAIKATLAGMDEEDYDPTSYEYDHRGRVIKTTSPKGTIQTYEHDIRGNYITARFIDSSVDNPSPQLGMVIRQEARGPTGPRSIFSNPSVMAGVYPVNSSTGPTGPRSIFSNPNVMAGVHPVGSGSDPIDPGEGPSAGDRGDGEGDGGPDESTCFYLVWDSHNPTSFTRDHRGRVVIRQNPVSPHLLVAYDNRNRVTEIGYYSSASGLAVGDTPSSKAGNRLALVTFSHDSRGTTWNVVRHNIESSDGSSVDSLSHFFWADERGRTIKSAADVLEKILFDSLGRPTHRFILAKDDDSTYADVIDPALSGDFVLEEHQTAYEPHTGNTLYSATIRRHYGDTTITGRLDSNADANAFELSAADLEGRAEITGYWYDPQDRLIDKVAFGTYGLNEGGGPSSFDRVAMSSAPARSDTALRTSYAYNTDGLLETVTDPRAIDTTYEYDPMGRVVLRIANDTGGSTASPTRDNDIYTRMSYFKSSDLSSVDPWVDELWVDVNGDGVQDAGVDQVTRYTYGVTGGFNSGDLLKSVTYPDGGVKEYGYHSSGILTSFSEPIGPSATVTTTLELDNLGRRISASVSVPSGVDSLVTGVAWTYDDLGRLASVTQSGGSGTVDQIVFEYNGWGNIAKIRQDHDSAVGAGGVPTHDVAFAYATATAGARTLRRTSMTLPNSNAVQYRYYGGNGSLDDAASRVSAIGRGNTDYVEYGYLGLDHVVGIEYPVADVFRRHYGTTAGAYPTLDRFDRVVHDRWTKDLATDIDFHDVDWSYDRNHNPLAADDHVHATKFDMKWTVDGINRVVQAERGELGSGSIATLAEDENWTLTTVGGWALHTLDGDGDGLLTTSGVDLDVTGTLNVANELTTRVDAAPSPTETYNLLYNDRGDLTDDGQAYKYTYDAFGRLRKVHNQSDELVAEYRYNGLGHLIAIHHDTNLDGDVDGDDRWLHLVYDDRWRVVAEHWDDEAKPHAIYVHHAGGVSGSGSYIDELAFRERDADNDTNQVLEERRYYAQNWRKDVVAMLTHDGALVEQVRYSSYGVPFGLPAGDTDSDGDFDLDDVNAITGSYDVRKDANLDGVVDVFDIIHAGNMAGGGGFVTTGRDVLGSVANANRFGYAAYLRDPAAPQWHVRHRVLRSDIGRWLTRDPAGYVDGWNLYEYVGSSAFSYYDPYGLGRVRNWLENWWNNTKEGWEGVKEAWRDIWNSPDPIGQYRQWAGDDEAIDEVQDALAACACIPFAEQIVMPINAALDVIQGDFCGAGASIVCGAIPGPGGPGRGLPANRWAPGPPGNAFPNVIPGGSPIVGGSGLPKIHCPRMSTRKQAKDAARASKRAKKGSPPVEHTNPDKGGPHFHPPGDVKPGSPHYEYPGKGPRHPRKDQT